MATRKKFEEIAEHLELSIFSGRLSVGDKIPSEPSNSTRFAILSNVSRPVPGKLQQLLAAGGHNVEHLARSPFMTMI